MQLDLFGLFQDRAGILVGGGGPRVCGEGLDVLADDDDGSSTS